MLSANHLNISNDKPFCNTTAAVSINEIKQNGPEMRDLISNMDKKIFDYKTEIEKLKTTNASLKSYDDLTSGLKNDLQLI